ncbi:MAG TPA: TRL-like family protein [Victivallales bacterium]|nr:TRL-like family protein [Victivallales bacterium]
MKMFYVLIMALTMASVAGCAFAPVVPPRGVMYNDQKAPLFGGRSAGSQSGESSAHNVMMLVGWGDCSIDAASKNGNIKLIKNVDYEMFSIFIFYQRFTTIVYGEKEISEAEGRRP